jgi:two-component system, chemotaxis family, sensor histidine kinase and response regulator PixL
MNHDKMSEEKERERDRQLGFQFLGEAQEYLNAIESGLLRIGSTKIDNQRIDEILRASHSIKGSAAMMGFGQLSHFAHRLEDFFKVIKIKKTDVVDEQIESLLLQAVDRLSHIVKLHLQEIELDRDWLSTEIIPLFDRLHEHFGNPEPEDTLAILSDDLEADMSASIFETEVEECLQNLEKIIETDDKKQIRSELIDVAQVLSGLGEMLEIPAFTSLCRSVLEHLNETSSEKIIEIAQTALKAWRRSQALVTVGQIDVLPTQLEFNKIERESASQTSDELIDSIDSMEDFLKTDNSEAIEAFFSLTEEIEAKTQEISQLESEQTEIEAAWLDRPSGFDCATASQTKRDLSSNGDKSPTERDLSPEAGDKKPSDRTEAVEEIETNIVEDESDKTIRVAVGQLEQLSEQFGEVAIERNALKLQIKNLRYLVNLLNQRIKKLEQSNFRLRVAYDRITVAGIVSKKHNPISIATEEIQTEPKAIEENSLELLNDNNFDALEMDRYNEIHLLSGDVIEGVVQVQEVSRDLEINLEETERNARQLNRTTKQMQNTISQVRMRPLADLLGRFPRALRDMELQYGKKVQMQVKGGSTLIERSILEALNDPLLHLFRNAFDHGIESPEMRRSRNKPERGSIAISAAHRGDRTVITVSDDGGGINIDKIRNRALEIGLDAEEINKAKERELLELIFEPGFSTATKITNLSGRGVGMDVVRTNVEKVKGKVEVSTELGIGTTFTITVPFSLSVMRVLLVETNGILLAFPSNAVEEVFMINPQTILATDEGESIEIDEKIVRLIRLEQWFTLPDRAERYTSDEIPAINEPTALALVKENISYAIQVDRYWREEEVTIRQVEGFLKMPPGLTGCTILGDGRVVPLVDTFALIDWIENFQKHNLANAMDSNRLANLMQDLNRQQSQESKANFYKNTILAIDDSINVRRFLAIVLEKANYRVEQAKDGQEAIEKLQAGIRVQAVICDLEMPRLDGYGFLSQIKSNDKYKNIPVIVLTSRNSDKHRRLAMNLGAAAYLNKPFQEPELLNTLEEVL